MTRNGSQRTLLDHISSVPKFLNAPTNGLSTMLDSIYGAIQDDTVLLEVTDEGFIRFIRILPSRGIEIDIPHHRRKGIKAGFDRYRRAYPDFLASELDQVFTHSPGASYRQEHIHSRL